MSLTDAEFAEALRDAITAAPQGSALREVARVTTTLGGLACEMADGGTMYVTVTRLEPSAKVPA